MEPKAFHFKKVKVTKHKGLQHISYSVVTDHVHALNLWKTEAKLL